MALILNILKYKWIIKMIFYWSAYKKNYIYIKIYINNLFFKWFMLLKMIKKLI
jgi:hypothetical protein